MDLHPDLETLIRYHDEELPPARREKVSGHVRECGECAAELRRVGLFLGLAPQPGAAGPAPGQNRLEDLLESIHAWRHGIAGEKLSRLVVEGIGPYLGPAAVCTVLQSVSPGGGNLLSTVEPVLALFLGGKAASKLIDHIVGTAIAGG